MNDIYSPISELINDRRYLAALKLIDEQIVNTSNDDKLLLFKTFCLYYLNDSSTAIDLAQLIISRNESCLKAYQLLSYCYIRQKRYQEALVTIDKALTWDQNSIESLNIRAGLLQVLNQLPECVRCFQKSIIIDPENWELHYNLASIYNQMKNYKNAILEYKSAYVLNPSYVTFISFLLSIIIKNWLFIYPVLLLLLLFAIKDKDPLLLIPSFVIFFFSASDNLRNKKWKKLSLLLVLIFVNIVVSISLWN